MKKIISIFFSIILVSFTFFGNMTNFDAASAKITVSSSQSRVILGNTFTVTVRVSSSANLGSWEFTIDYNTKLFKLVSGRSYVADVYTSSSQKSATYTYKFKAISSGTGKVGVKSYSGHAKDESRFSMTAGSSNIRVMTQAELEASYSKNNNLSSLSVTGYTLSPAFNSNTTTYKVELGSNVEKIAVNAKTADSKAKLSGTGTIEVSEGENKIDIVVTAENGSKKTYTIIANVTDPNPINVKDIDGKDLVVVKRESSLTPPSMFTPVKVKVENQEVPGFFNELNNITLVGLKDNEGNTGLYIYNLELNTFEKYSEYLMNQLKVLVLNIEENPFEQYEMTKIDIDGFESTALKVSTNQYIIYAKNLDTGENHYYLYDTRDNTAIKYTPELTKNLEDKVDKYFKIIMILCGESVILFIVLISLLVSSSKRNKRKREEIKKRKEALEKDNDKDTKDIQKTEELKLNDEKPQENKKEDTHNKKKEKDKKKNNKELIDTKKDEL